MLLHSLSSGFMRHVIDTSEVLGTIETAEGSFELCASADAGFDSNAGLLGVELRAFFRPVGKLAKASHLRFHWLPSNETVMETCSHDESTDVAKDVFRSWVRKVHEAASLLNLVHLHELTPKH